MNKTDIAGEVKTNSKADFFYRPLHMNVLVLVKICSQEDFPGMMYYRWWERERERERECVSGNFVLPARRDDNDDFNSSCILFVASLNNFLKVHNIA